MKKTFVLLASMAVMASAAMASEKAQIQSYAHPTLFGSEAQVDVNATTSSIIGGKITKCPNCKTIASKDNVAIKSFAKQELDKFAQNTTGKFDSKTPVLRGELAQTLADGLNLSSLKDSDDYSDVPSSYWAKQAIDEALAADIMIGYPDKTFKPDQKVTKAEVFCTLAKIFDVDHSETATPVYNSKAIQHIPNWAVGATNEVLATGILDSVPDESALINNEYLTKEQVAYLVGALSEYIKAHPETATSRVSTTSAGSSMLIKMDERLSARTSNAGDTFSATLVEATSINGTSYPAGAKVRGVVSEVVRPGVNNTGYIKVQFKEIKNGDSVVALPETVFEASTVDSKDANILARVVGAPLSASARVLGVAGRTVSQQALLTSNGVEKYGDELSNTLVNVFSLQPVAGAKKFGASFVTAGKYVWNTAENAVSGVYGVGYELVDEVRYLVAPKYSNNSSLNPKETIKVTFEE
jgi:hypothetical protein